MDIDDQCENMATCATHHLVKIWDITDPLSIYLKLVLDHKTKIINMPKATKTCTTTLALDDQLVAFNTTTQQLIKSNANLIDDVILNAHEDIPEITNVYKLN